MSHISVVQTPVKASGKKSSTVFFCPKLFESFTSTRPVAVLDLREKSGALEPTAIAINKSVFGGFGFSTGRCSSLGGNQCQTAIPPVQLGGTECWSGGVPGGGFPLAPSLHHSITPTLQHSLTPSLHHSAPSQRLQHLGGVFLRLHLGPDVLDPAVGADQERDPVGSLILSAHEDLLTPHAIRLHDLPVFVSDQRERQLELVRELVVRPHAVGADAQHHGALLLELLPAVTKRTRLLRAAGRVVPGIEIQHHRFAPEVGKFDQGPAVGRRGEVGCRISGFELERWFFGHDEVQELKAKFTHNAGAVWSNPAPESCSKSSAAPSLHHSITPQLRHSVPPVAELCGLAFNCRMPSRT